MFMSRERQVVSPFHGAASIFHPSTNDYIDERRNVYASVIVLDSFINIV